MRTHSSQIEVNTKPYPNKDTSFIRTFSAVESQNREGSTKENEPLVFSKVCTSVTLVQYETRNSNLDYMQLALIHFGNKILIGLSFLFFTSVSVT